MIDVKELKEIAYKYGTPSYIFDVDELGSRLDEMERILDGKAEICYAMKANPFLLGYLKDRVTKFEVCSPGEFAICEQEEIPLKNIVLSGVNKEFHDISHVVKIGGVGVYTVESLNQLKLLEKCADSKMKVLLRVTSGNQFGLNESDIYNIVRDRDNYPHIDIEGIQLYSGTQKKKMAKIEAELNWMKSIADKCENEFGLKLKEIEYGPGLSVNYFNGEENTFEDLECLSDLLTPLAKDFKITLEMGRYVAATCGILITRIADMKYNDEQRYAIVDSGINHINYYGQTMAMKLPKTEFIAMEDCEGEPEYVFQGENAYNICGSLCTVGDVIVKNLKLTDARVGDMIAFYNLGAYSITEGIYLFLSRRMPSVLQYSKRYGVRVLRKPLESWKFNTRD